MTTQHLAKARCAVFAALLLALPAVALADPPSEDVLRRDVPSDVGFYIEPYLGINYSLFNPNAATWGAAVFRAPATFEGTTDMFESASGLGLRGGVNFGFQFTPQIALALGVGYDGYRATGSGRTIDLCTIEDPNTGGSFESPEEIDKEYTISADFVTLYAAGVFTFGSVFVDVGPAIGVGLNGRYEESWHVVSSETECRYFYQTPDSTRDIEGSFEDSLNAAIRGAIRLGLGTTIEISDGMYLVPRLGFEFGLNDAFEESESDVEIVMSNPSGPEGLQVGLPFNESIRVHAIQLSLGLRFSL